MDHVEVSKLLTLIAAIDNREVNPVTIEVWQRIMEKEDYETMASAVPEYFATSEAYLAPRGLIAVAKRMKEAKAQQNAHAELQSETKDWKSDPEPICRKHNLGITKCLDCCKTIYARADKMPAHDRHRWAVDNIYA